MIKIKILFVHCNVNKYFVTTHWVKLNLQKNSALQIQLFSSLRMAERMTNTCELLLNSQDELILLWHAIQE